MQRFIAKALLVSADGFAVDASLIAAAANKQRSVASKDWKLEKVKENAVRAPREYLATSTNSKHSAARTLCPQDPGGICMKTPAT